jgi:hypothetical protein
MLKSLVLALLFSTAALAAAPTRRGGLSPFDAKIDRVLGEKFQWDKAKAESKQGGQEIVVSDGVADGPVVRIFKDKSGKVVSMTLAEGKGSPEKIPLLGPDRLSNRDLEHDRLHDSGHEYNRMRYIAAHIERALPPSYRNVVKGLANQVQEPYPASFDQNFRGFLTVFDWRNSKIKRRTPTAIVVTDKNANLTFVTGKKGELQEIKFPAVAKQDAFAYRADPSLGRYVISELQHRLSASPDEKVQAFVTELPQEYQLLAGGKLCDLVFRK